jgi:hypothetical protein
MASKRRLRRKSCTGKIRYNDQSSAAAQAFRARVFRQAGNVRAYLCKFCNGYHIGHQS